MCRQFEKLSPILHFIRYCTWGLRRAKRPLSVENTGAAEFSLPELQTCGFVDLPSFPQASDFSVKLTLRSR